MSDKQSHKLITQSDQAVVSNINVSKIIANTGQEATIRYLEFFAVTIRNKNTRIAYITACKSFFSYCSNIGLVKLDEIEPLHAAAYIEFMTNQYEAPTVKQHLAALRMMFDWMVTGQFIAINPAHAVRGPKQSNLRGKTPVLTPKETRSILDAIDLKNEVAYRDRALIALMAFSFARVSAALSCCVKDYVPRGKRWWLVLKEKGGKIHEMPVHHTLEQYLDEYLDYANIKDEPSGFIFRAANGRSGKLSTRPLTRNKAWEMVKRRTAAAGIKSNVTNHSFRATGITAYLNAGGSLEHAQEMAAHSSPRTTKLYDRTKDGVSLDEVERIVI